MSNESENKQENDNQYIQAMLKEKKRTEALNRICKACGAPSHMHTMRGCFDE